jgi:uncharacterized protein (UPF0179 family)
MNKKTIISLVGKSFAKKGFRFYYKGKQPTCNADCKLFQTCQKNLDPDTVYEVVELMKSGPSAIKTHNCPKDLHEEEMILVKLIVPDVYVTMVSKNIFVGSVTRYTPINCTKVDCPHYEFCVPELMIKPNDKILIKEKVEQITDCSKGETLSKIKIEKKSD